MSKGRWDAENWGNGAWGGASGEYTPGEATARRYCRKTRARTVGSGAVYIPRSDGHLRLTSREAGGERGRGGKQTDDVVG